MDSCEGALATCVAALLFVQTEGTRLEGCKGHIRTVFEAHRAVLRLVVHTLRTRPESGLVLAERAQVATWMETLRVEGDVLVEPPRVTTYMY